MIGPYCMFQEIVRSGTFPVGILGANSSRVA